MRIRLILGVIVTVVGFLSILTAAANFNSMFFGQELTKREDIPLYSSRVVRFFIFGLLILLDGALILGFKRIYAIIGYIVGNILWIYAAFVLLELLSVPVTTIATYQQVFIGIVASLVFLVLGLILNDIPKTVKASTYS